MVSDECEIYHSDHSVHYVISNHWGVQLKLIMYVKCDWKLRMAKKNNRVKQNTLKKKKKI